MYKMEQFQEKVINYLEEVYPENSIHYEVINGRKAIVISELLKGAKGGSISPVIYLDSLYQSYRQTGDLEAIKDFIVNDLDLKIPIKKFKDLIGKVTYDDLRVRVLPGNFNQSGDFCTRDFLSLKLLLVIELKDGDSICTVKLQRDTLLYFFSDSEDTLWDIAINNTENDEIIFSNLTASFLHLEEGGFPVSDERSTILSLDAIKSDIEGCREEITRVINSCEIVSNLFLLARADRSYSANIVLNTDLLTLLSDAFCCNLFILPSSVHEILIVPEVPNELTLNTTEELHELVQSTNKNVVSEEEFLSNEIFYFDRNSQKVLQLTNV